MEYPNDSSLRVSHETIYRSLFIQARGALKQELFGICAPSGGSPSRHSSVHGHSRGQIVVSIRERPAEADDRAIPGHREGDLRAGADNSDVITLVERASRFCMLRKVAGKDTATVVAALSQHIGQLPAAPRRSLTGIAGWRWRSAKPSRWRPMYRSTSVIRRALGSAAQPKTPIACIQQVIAKRAASTNEFKDSAPVSPRIGSQAFPSLKTRQSTRL
jgi:hypothetical protein